jgi:hypothetical protein
VRATQEDYVRQQNDCLVAERTQALGEGHLGLAALLSLPAYYKPIPDAPNLGNTRFSTRKAYHDRMGKKSRTAVIYFDDKDGRPHSAAWNDALSERVRDCWATLADLHLAPAKWGERNNIIFDWLKQQVYPDFPDVMLCELDWKLRYWCQTHYSSWRDDHIGKAAEVKAQYAGHKTSAAMPMPPPVIPATPPPSKSVRHPSSTASSSVLQGDLAVKRARSRSMQLCDDEDHLRYSKHAKAEGNIRTAR